MSQIHLPMTACALLLISGCGGDGVVPKHFTTHKGMTFDKTGTICTCVEVPNTDRALADAKNLKTLRSLSLKGCDVTDLGMRHLKSKTAMRKLLIIDCPQITDMGMANIQDWTQLQDLTLLNNRITNDGLKHLRKMRKLTRLRVTDLNDRGLAHLRYLSGLEQLELFDAEISYAGVEYFQWLSRLKVLTLYRCKITDAVESQLRRVLPNTRIVIT